MSARRRWLGAAAVATLLAALLGSLDGGRPLEAAKDLAKRVLGYPAWRQRAASRSEGAYFDHLAASQVGYTPSMPKEFTSPRPFGAFRVIDERNGLAAFQGGPPVRVVHTDLVGPPGSAWIGDFTALTAPGRYRVEIDGGLASFPFEVRPDVFDGAIRATQRALYFQRAFTAIDARHAEGPWTHPSDAHLAPPGVVKGWHDAGDFTIYSATAASTLFWLMEAASDFGPEDDRTNIPESGNGVPDLLDEARWGLEWMLSVQDGSGGFRNTTCQEAYGRYGSNWPDRMPPYRPGEVGTLATARAVGTLAYASVVYRRHDPAFAEGCLAAARRGYAYLQARPTEDSDGPTCPNFRQDGDAQAGRDTRLYAAAGMLVATGEERFRRDYEARHALPSGAAPLASEPSAYRLEVFAALLYLRAEAGSPARQATIRERLRERSAQARAEGDAHPFQWTSRYIWGSIAAGFHRAAAFSAKACLLDPVGAQADCRQALANLHYALGRNSLQRCYVSGLEGVSRGRTHAFHHWLAALRATPFLFPGLVAGGPAEAPVETDVSYPHARPIPIWGYWGDPAMPRDAATPVDARYTDNDSWSTNELDVDWQAVTLYQLHFARWWSRWQEGRPDRDTLPPPPARPPVIEGRQQGDP